MNLTTLALLVTTTAANIKQKCPETTCKDKKDSEEKPTPMCLGRKILTIKADSTHPNLTGDDDVKFEVGDVRKW